MGAAATKAVGNVYYEARKKAAMYNDRLSSREGAAEASRGGVSSKWQRAQWFCLTSSTSFAL